MILVFAGAGASASIDRRQYPTTVEFFKRFQRSEANAVGDRWFTAISEYLQERIKYSSRQSSIDIELVLDELEKMRAYCDTSLSTTKLPGWILSSKFTQEPSRLRTYFPLRIETSTLKQFLDAMGQARRELEELQSRIFSCVYQYYAPRPPEIALANWMSLLTPLASPYRGLEIFTTNYDRVLEQVILKSKELVPDIPNVKDVVLGRKYDKGDLLLDLECWNPDRTRPDGQRVQLTKLHGSVDWQHSHPSTDFDEAAMEASERLLQWTPETAKELGETKISVEKRVLISSPIFTGSHANHAVLYPASKGEPEEEPFITFHNHLQLVVEKAEAAVFIGYAFRDDYINRILSNLPPDIPKVVIDKEQSPPNADFLRVAAYFGDGFTDQSVAMCLEYMKQRGVVLRKASTN